MIRLKMKKQSRKKALIFVVVTFTVLWCWDYYMRVTWDNEILIEDSEYYIQFIDHNQKSYKILSKEEIQNLPEVYRGGVEIIKIDGEYFLNNDVKSPLVKTVEIYNPEKEGWLTERTEVDRNFSVFKTDNEEMTIRMATDQYIHYGCYPLVSKGNTVIIYTLGDGNKLMSYSDANVYENLIQYILCR